MIPIQARHRSNVHERVVYFQALMPPRRSRRRVARGACRDARDAPGREAPVGNVAIARDEKMEITMNERQCIDCKFFQESTVAEYLEDERLQGCHFNPPQVNGVHGGIQYAHWPIVRKTDWCGQFSPKKVTERNLK